MPLTMMVHGLPIDMVVRLIYTSSGLALFAHTSSAIHICGNGSATADVAPRLWQPPSRTLMTNDINGKPTEESVACIDLSKTDSYIISASSGKVSLFNIETFEIAYLSQVMAMFMPPPPTATFLAFHPQDNNIIAIGMEDSTIQIYKAIGIKDSMIQIFNVRVDKVIIKLKGYQNRITGLAFAQTLNALVSSGANGQLCMWSIDIWEKLKSRFIQAPAGCQSPLWSPKDTLPAPISSAIYSCDGLLVYAGFCDGAVGVFDADNLRL
ncbi:protein TOPLESS-RELATED PROTEIN 2-like [Mangifera indica]|uniref:protein TOPLESS-RELATED PROTEIN 2-like n=1 Tax=Mangifera indica TaxID=29780 RepID=UPI001CF937F7|nr:protein TOPLESS-RELATED PROTEIN 2-like [Mangifera indica]